MSVGDKLSRLRKENNYTQEQLADILGVSRQAISKWESDVAYPETDKLIRLSMLYHVTLDYLVKDDATLETVQPRRRSIVLSEKVNKLVGVVLRFAPLTFYGLWALLLWALYTAPLLKKFDGDVYQWIGNIAVSELQPVIIAFISFGAISGVYIVALALLQRFANKKINLIANICSFALQLAIFLCAMGLIGVCNSIGLEAGKVVVVVATITGVFALFQAVFMILEYYFNKEARISSSSKKVQSVQKTANWFKLHKAVAAVVCCVLVIGVALSVVLPLTVGNIFQTSKVSSIQIGDNEAQVKKILGEPMDNDAANATGSLGRIISSQYSYLYCTPKMERLLKDFVRILYEQTYVDTKDDKAIVNTKLINMMYRISEVKFKYISVQFYNGAVVGVEFNNSKVSMDQIKDVKWNVIKGDQKQSLKLIPDELLYGETPYSAELYAQIFYPDGSYKLGGLENMTAHGNVETGWKLTWYDDWGYYNGEIKVSSDTSNTLVEQGEDDGVSYSVDRIYKNGEAALLLTLSGQGEIKSRRTGYKWSAYANQNVVEIDIGGGITNVPAYAFASFANLEKVNLPESLTEIGNYAFRSCYNLKNCNYYDGITTIGDYAFSGCKSLLTAPISTATVSIGDHAFQNCNELTQVRLFENLTTIGEWAFSDCQGLTELTISNVTEIGYSAFANCTALCDVKISANEYKLDANTFYCCTALKELDLTGAIYIGENVFYGCEELTNVTLGSTNWYLCRKHHVYGDELDITVSSGEDAATKLRSYNWYSWSLR
ncbi:MAG: leucine-rich repeat protein [Clostridiales bacterium]|nr:leucine-rich repeat protein [Clostridiales bacterium]